jgi:hypothetical protein
MIDFTVKGTKLPIVPTGTERATVNVPHWYSLNGKREGFISFGSTVINGEECILADEPHYTKSNYFIFKVKDLERLAKEQGMVSKELPKYWVVQCDTIHPDWHKVIDYLNTIDKGWGGNIHGDYYGFDGSAIYNGTYASANLSAFKNNPTVLTIEEFVSLTNQKISNMFKITREQLHSIHKIACSEWQTKIHRIAERFPFSNEIELSKEEVDQMFKAATANQLPTLEGIFGARPKDINLKSATVNAQVDGINIFGNSDAKRDSAFISLPVTNSVGSNVFYLNRDYKWTYDPANETLIVNRK